MDFKLTTATGKASTKTVQLADATFGQEYNEALVHQVVTAYLAGGRSGTVKQKTRAEVSGGGIKPFKQKGSGRARAGSIRSPLWRTGGKIFAAVPQDHSQKVNRKMYRGALCAILSELVRQERLVVVEQLALDAPKTKELAVKLKAMGLDDVLIVSETIDDKLYLSARNLPRVDVRSVHGIDPVSLIRNEKVLMTVGAVSKIGEMLA